MGEIELRVEMRRFNNSHFLSHEEQRDMRDRQNMAARVFFFLTMLALMIYTSALSSAFYKNPISKSDCLKDKTFEWTEGLNNFFLENRTVRDWVIMFNSLWYDVTLFSLVFFFRADKLPSFTFALGLIIGALSKTFV